MADVTIEVTGVDAWTHAVDVLMDSIRAAAFAGVSDAMGIIHEAIAENLRLTSHPPGTPTPSAPGEPPSLITGNLIRSIQEIGPFWLSENVIAGYVGPSAVYARIQEFGGDTGRNHATHLPPRPYARPAVDEVKDRARGALGARVAEAFRAG